MALEKIKAEIEKLHAKVQEVANKMELLKKENMILLQDNVDLKKKLERNKNSSFVLEKQEEKNQRSKMDEGVREMRIRKELDQSIAQISDNIDWLKKLYE